MPGNTIKINNYDGLEWYIGDSRIDQVIELLDKVGFKTGDDMPEKTHKINIEDKND